MPRRPAQEIADALRSEILAGHLRPGDQVPSEHDLARQFSTTRSNFDAEAAAQGHKAERRVLEVATVSAPADIAERLGRSDQCWAKPILLGFHCPARRHRV